jgi:hypothetical protein
MNCFGKNSPSLKPKRQKEEFFSRSGDSHRMLFSAMTESYRDSSWYRSREKRNLVPRKMDSVPRLGCDTDSELLLDIPTIHETRYRSDNEFTGKILACEHCGETVFEPLKPGCADC